jgi:hypothetical protein
MWMKINIIILYATHLGGKSYFMYFVQHGFICRPSDSTVSEDAGIYNPGLLRLWHWQTDARLDFIHTPKKSSIYNFFYCTSSTFLEREKVSTRYQWHLSIFTEIFWDFLPLKIKRFSSFIQAGEKRATCIVTTIQESVTQRRRRLFCCRQNVLHPLLSIAS